MFTTFYRLPGFTRIANRLDFPPYLRVCDWIAVRATPEVSIGVSIFSPTTRMTRIQRRKTKQLFPTLFFKCNLYVTGFFFYIVYTWIVSRIFILRLSLRYKLHFRVYINQQKKKIHRYSTLRPHDLDNRYFK